MMFDDWYFISCCNFAGNIWEIVVMKYKIVFSYLNYHQERLSFPEYVLSYKYHFTQIFARTPKPINTVL